jgi:CspA family cold shock protein
MMGGSRVHGTGRTSAHQEDHVATGTISRLTDRGFGFIKQEDGTDLFFHRSQVTGTGFDALTQGQSVTYEKGVSDRSKKEEAQNVSAA